MTGKQASADIAPGARVLEKDDGPPRRWAATPGLVAVLKELSRFGLSTIGSAAITVCLPIVLHGLLHVEDIYAILISFCIAFFVNFCVMRYFVFDNKGRMSGDFARYIVSNLSFRAGEYLSIAVLTRYFHIYYVVSILFVLSVSTVLKFGVYKLLVFRPGWQSADGGPVRRPDPVAAASFVGVVLCCALILAIPAVANGHVILFPDSVGYYRSGEAILHFLGQVAHDPSTASIAPDQVSDARSVFYGLPLFLLYDLFGEWGICVCQCLCTAAVMVAGARRSIASPGWRYAAVLGTASVSGIGFFASAAMPDVFAGPMIFGAAILIGQWERLTSGERAFWFVATLYGMLVHKGHILVLLVVALAMAAILFGRGRRPFAPLVLLGIAVAIAFSGFQMADVATRAFSGQPPKHFPFLLARTIGDGTVKPYLDAECARKAYVLCRYRQRLTMTENEFLWSVDPHVGLYALLDDRAKAQVNAEAGAIVRGAVVARPLHQLGQTAWRMAWMNLDVGITRYRMAPEAAAGDGVWPLVRAYQGSPITDGRIPVVAISWWMRAVYGLAFVTLFGLAWRRPSLLLGLDDLTVTRQAVLVGVIANACVFGAISSAADRYQGRVAWLVILLALAACRASFAVEWPARER